jgi:hypothetical protein
MSTLIVREEYRYLDAELLITRGKPVAIQQFVLGDGSLREWLSLHLITAEFLALQDWGIDSFKHNFIEPLHLELHDTTRTYTQTVYLEAGCLLISFNGRSLNFPDRARENQLLVSAGLMPIDETGKALAEGTTLADVRKWNLEREVPAHELNETPVRRWYASGR